MPLPADPGFDSLWDFSLRVYARPGIAAACLRLQDRHGADVNLLLYCGWLAAIGAGVPDAAAMRAAIDGTADWQAEVVKPLRSVRRSLKPRAMDDASLAGLREAVKRLELESERIEQQILGRLAHPAVDAGRSREDRRRDALTGFAAYLAALGALPDEADHHDMEMLAAACVG